MCLDRLDKITHKRGIGYKVCEKDTKNGDLDLYKSWDWPGARGTPYPLNRWTTDFREGLTDFSPKYLPGFHISLNKNKARKIAKDFGKILIAVKYRNVVAQENDTETYGTVIVARDIINKGEVKIK